LAVNALLLDPSHLRQIHREGAAAYPNECCGALIGRETQEHRQVERLRPLANSFDAAEQFHRFRLDALELARVEKEAGAEGKLVLGFYHSHPDHPARPSDYDRQHAWPFYSYVIVAIEKGAAAALTSWRLNDQTEQFEQETILSGNEPED
jgi:proteasome lid subunit RPN8/RPN11